MANIVIVTQQCYLLCEAINYIAINEIDGDNESRLTSFFKEEPKKGKKAKKPTKKQIEEWKRQQFQIIIDFVPANGITVGSSSHKSGGNTATVAIKVSGRDKCLGLFSHMVEQIREQIPDNKFLDDIVNKFLQEDK